MKSGLWWESQSSFIKRGRNRSRNRSNPPTSTARTRVSPIHFKRGPSWRRVLMSTSLSDWAPFSQARAAKRPPMESPARIGFWGLTASINFKASSTISSASSLVPAENGLLICPLKLYNKVPCPASRSFGAITASQADVSLVRALKKTKVEASDATGAWCSK